MPNTLELNSIEDIKNLKVKAGWKFWAVVVSLGVGGLFWYRNNEARMKALEDHQIHENENKIMDTVTQTDLTQFKSDMRVEWRKDLHKARKIKCDRFVLRGLTTVPCSIEFDYDE